MAEVVEFRSEEMIPEFEQMEKMQLFHKDEIKNIIKRREEFEYKLQRQTKSKEDILRYIQYEMDLLKLIRQKRAEKGLNQKKNSVDSVIANHINKLFSFAIRRFSGEVRIWLSYIKFCTQMRFHSCASRVLDQMLELHGDKPSLFKLAAQWEFEECQCVEKARTFLLNGIRHHKDSKLLYKEAFLLELNYSSQKRNEILGRGEAIDSSDPVLNGKLAEVIYDSAVKQFTDVDFVVELLGATKEHSFTDALQKKILDDLVTRFPSEELTWDTRARRELEVVNKDPSDPASKLTLKERIKNCTMMYEKAVKILHTEKMWAMYLDHMLELSKDTATLPNMRKNCLMRAFSGAHSQGLMSEKYYLIWVEHLEGSEKKEKLYEVLKGGTQKLPGSVTLWVVLLRYHLTMGEEVAADRVFREALAGLGDASLPVWKLMLRYYQNTNPTKAEELFKEGIDLTPGISNPLKPLYLEWLTLSRGIMAARKAYSGMAQAVPFCLEMHTKMAELEDIQPRLNLKHSRKCHQMTCLQFGSTNTDVWMAYVKFEQKYGNPKHVSEIYSRAIRSLKSDLVDTFVSEFSLSKTEAFLTPQCLQKFDRNEEPMEIS